MSVLAALTLVLGVLGRHINRWRLFTPRESSGFWSRFPLQPRPQLRFNVDSSRAGARQHAPHGPLELVVSHPEEAIFF